MYKYSKISQERLNTVDKRLQQLFNEVIKYYDCSIICGYRTIEEQKQAFKNKVSNCDGVKKKSKHCIDVETEILTNNGWKNIDTINKNDLCYSFNIETEKIEQTEILEIIKQKKNEPLIHIKSSHVDLLLTDEHNLLLKKFNGQYQNKNLKDFSKSDYHNELKKKYKLEKVKNIFNKRIQIPIAGIEEQSKSIYDLNYLKLLIAIICDGTINKDKKYDSYDISFNLKKERKISFLENILKKLNFNYSKTYCKSREKNKQYGVYCINILGGKEIKQKIVELITTQKIIPDFFIDLSAQEKQELIETYTFFDGCKNRDDFYVIKSIKEENIDKLQIMCITSNYRCVKNKIKKEELTSTFEHKHDLYYLNIAKNKNITRINENTAYSLVDYNNYVWCISNKNHTIIVRRKGKVSIIGNCSGLAIDVVPYSTLYSNINNFYELAGVVKTIAKQLNIDVKWGGDWENFKDYAHWEL